MVITCIYLVGRSSVMAQGTHSPLSCHFAMLGAGDLFADGFISSVRSHPGWASSATGRRRAQGSNT